MTQHKGAGARKPPGQDDLNANLRLREFLAMSLKPFVVWLLLLCGPAHALVPTYMAFRPDWPSDSIEDARRGRATGNWRT